MTFKVIRSAEYFKYHTINSDDVIKYGLEKACVLGNLEKGAEMHFEELFHLFPYIEKARFYAILQELINEGLLLRK